MPLRWAEPRESYDPEADVGLPRPFILESKARRPSVRHSLRQPKDPRKTNPLQPWKPPTFFDLPHQRASLRNKKTEMELVRYVRMTTEQAQQAGKRLLFDPKTLQFRTFDLTLGKRGGAGVYAVLKVAPGKNPLNVVFIKLPPAYTVTDRRSFDTYFEFLWKYDRKTYWAAADMYQRWKWGARDASKKAYDTYKAEWESWVKAEQKKAKALVW